MHSECETLETKQFSLIVTAELTDGSRKRGDLSLQAGNPVSSTNVHKRKVSARQSDFLTSSVKSRTINHSLYIDESHHWIFFIYEIAKPD